MTGILAVALVVGVPALAFALWPLLRRASGGRAFLALPPDPREQLLEDKRAVLRALREIEFEHQAGHVSAVDYGELRARYETEAAAILEALDRLEPREPVASGPAAVGESRGPRWRHPAVLAGSAVALVAFGVALGAGVVRHTAPDPSAGLPMIGSRPLAPGFEAGAAPPAGDAVPRAIPPQVLRGMLSAARQSLFAGRPQEASAAYQAVLRRDPQNVDALTHLGLLLVMSADGAERGQLVDHALMLFDRALAIDPEYPPALLYRGQVLYEAKRDLAGAIASWEKFVAVSPPGEDRERVQQMIAEAKAARPAD